MKQRFYHCRTPEGPAVALFCRFPYTPDTELTAQEALPIQKAYLATLRGQTPEQLRICDALGLVAEAEAVLRKIEDALAQEDYQKTLYKD